MMDTCFLDPDIFHLNKCICVWNLPVNHEFVPYSHDFIMIAFIAKGSGVHYIKDKKIPVAEGDIFVINPDIMHCFYTAAPGLTMTIYYCCFDPKVIPEYHKNLSYAFPGLKSFLDNTRIQYLQLHDSAKREIQSFFITMIDDFTFSLPGHEYTLKYSVILLMTKILRIYTTENEVISYSHNKIVDQSVRFILQNLNQELRLDVVAKNQTISVSQLNKLFKKYTGTTVINYINQLRVEKIKYLLATTTRPIHLICMEFNLTPKHLNRLFQKHTGYTMHQYREKH